MDKSKRRVFKVCLVLTGGVLGVSGCGGSDSSSGGDSASAGSGGIAASGRRAEISGNVAENFNNASGRRDGIDVTAGGRNATTNASGQFTITDVPPGSQDVVFNTDRNATLGKSGGALFSAISSIRVDVPEGGSVEFSNVRLRDELAVADQIIFTTAEGVTTSIRGGSLPPVDDDTNNSVPTSNDNTLF